LFEEGLNDVKDPRYIKLRIHFKKHSIKTSIKHTELSLCEQFHDVKVIAIREIFLRAADVRKLLNTFKNQLL